MSEPCNTVKIKATTGSYPYSVINESDFDAEKHTLYLDDLAERLMQVEVPEVEAMVDAPAKRKYTRG